MPTRWRFSYITSLMNLNMKPGGAGRGGGITVIGTEALNHKRFEPNAKGRVPARAGRERACGRRQRIDGGFEPAPELFDRHGSADDARSLHRRSARASRGVPDGLRAYVCRHGFPTTSSSPMGALARVANINVGKGPVAVSYDGASQSCVRAQPLLMARSPPSRDNSLTVTSTVSMYDPDAGDHPHRPARTCTTRTRPAALGHASLRELSRRCANGSTGVGSGRSAGARSCLCPTTSARAALGILCGNFHPMKGANGDADAHRHHRHRRIALARRPGETLRRFNPRVRRPDGR